MTASQAGDDTYAPADDVSASIEVAAPPPPEPVDQTIDFALPADGTVGDRVALEGSASSGLRVHYHAETPGTCSIDGDGLLLEDAGTCTVTASQAGDDTYAPADDVSASIEVAAPPPPEPADQTIDFDSPPTLTVYGDRVYEGDSGTSPLTFEVDLSHPVSTGVTFHYATTDDTATAGSDYVATIGRRHHRRG